MLIQINNYTVSLEPSNNSVKNDAVRHINKEKCAKFKDSPGANNVLLHCVCCIKISLISSGLEEPSSKCIIHS